MTPKKFRARCLSPRGNYRPLIELGVKKYLQDKDLRHFGKQLLAFADNWVDRQKLELEFIRIIGQSRAAGKIFSNINDYHCYFKFGKRCEWYKSSLLRRSKRMGRPRMKLRLFHFLCTKEMRTDSCSTMNIPKRRKIKSK